MTAPAPTGVAGIVYLIHFERPLAHAQHYIGWTTDLEQRVAAHARGAGSPLLRAANAAGIGWRVERTWSNVDRHFERALKRQHGARGFCPACHA